MDPDQVKAAIEALKNNDAAAALTILEALIVSAAGGNADAAADVEAEADPLAQMPDAPKPEEAVAALTSLRLLSGHVNLGEAIEFVKVLKAEADKTIAQAAALEQSSRLELVGQLVKLGVETPATAWEDADARKPSKFLAAMPIADLRARVVALSASKPRPHTPPERKTEQSPAPGAAPGSKVITLSDGRSVTISAAEIVACDKRNMSHEVFAAKKLDAVKRV